MEIKHPELFYDLIYKYLSINELNNAPGLKDDGKDIDRIKKYLILINKKEIFEKVLKEYKKFLNDID